MAETKTDPTKFLSSIIGSTVVVKLHNNVEYQGDLQSIDGYMNVVLHSAKESVQKSTTKSYGDVFIRGNNANTSINNKMSFIIRRQLSTLIPPKIASAKNIGSNPNAKRMAEVVSFYKKLPTGPAPAAKKPTTPWGKYKAAYFDGDNASGKPLIHLAVFIIIAGYTWEYQSHLKHHKH